MQKTITNNFKSECVKYRTHEVLQGFGRQTKQGERIMSYEVWKDVVGYEGLYQISNLGRVKSMERFRNGMIKEYGSAKDAEMDGFNHSLIAACCKGKQKTTRGCKYYYKVDYYGNPT